ncbi:MAG TPA: hypothetical protein VFU43_05605 [Streptosporangiaceae bacterium]|nr:hypothetical protein [Streptosporangiaceae bacterium]
MAQPFGPGESPPLEPPARRSNRRVIAVLAGVAALVVVAAVAVAVVVLRSGETTYRIVTPAQAGGLKLGSSGPSPVDTASANYQNLQKVLRNRAQTAVNVVYEDTAGTLYSLKLASGDLGDPTDLLTRLRANPPVAERSAVLTITTRWNALAETNAGPHGGVAACGDVVISTGLSSLPTGHLTQCAWQTEHTYGEVAVPLPKSGPVTTDGLANSMRRLRADLEKPA